MIRIRVLHDIDGPYLWIVLCMEETLCACNTSGEAERVKAAIEGYQKLLHKALGL